MEEEIRPQENMGLYYHQLSKDASMGGKIKFSKDSSLWPDSWKKIEYKKYNKTIFSVDLTKDSLISFGPEAEALKRIFDKRKSGIDFTRKSVISKDKISALLQLACGFSDRKFPINSGNDKHHKDFYRYYPSAGGRYPLEIYLFINDVEGFLNGIYHFNLRNYKLDMIRTLESLDPGLFVEDTIVKAKCILFTTAVFDRIFRKYAERGYRYVLLEAGHVAQNINLVANSIGLEIILLGGVKYLELENIIGIDGLNESLLYTIAIY